MTLGDFLNNILTIGLTQDDLNKIPLHIILINLVINMRNEKKMAEYQFGFSLYRVE